jgi:HD-GYP domain-containing protein (c-di-GMP phosphodiesterase class II)
MADHTVVGHQIVSGVQFPWPQVPEVVRWHHERADGTGYPDALQLEDVPLPARIVALADAFDAMTSERPYRQPLSLGETLSELVHLSPQKFDPAAMQGLLIQLRRDAVGSNQNSFLDERIACNLAAGDIDNLAANLQHKLNHGKLYLT